MGARRRVTPQVAVELGCHATIHTGPCLLVVASIARVRDRREHIATASELACARFLNWRPVCLPSMNVVACRTMDTTASQTRMLDPARRGGEHPLHPTHIRQDVLDDSGTH